MNQNVLFALAAAVWFGASTPLAKLLVGEVSPVLLGGLLYLVVVLGWGCSDCCVTGPGTLQDFKRGSGHGSWEPSSLEVFWGLWP